MRWPTSELARATVAALGIRDLPRVDPARVLVALFMPIGDLLFAQPAIQALRVRYPQAHITALTTRERADLVTAFPLVGEVPVFDAYLIYDDTPDHGALDRLDETMRHITRQRFDMVVSFSPAGNCVAILSGIPRQIWQRLPLAFWLWGARFDAAYRDRHAVEHYWEVVAQLGLRPQSVADHVPRWRVSAEEYASAQAQLKELFSDDPATGPIVILHPGAAGFGGRKRWPAPAFAELACQLAATYDARIVILGGPTDLAAAEVILAAAPRARSLVGALRLRASIAIAAQAATYIGCDSGILHFAVALGVPTVALFGLSDLTTFRPRAADSHLLRVVTPQPLPAPEGHFIGVDSIFFPPQRPPISPMDAITVEQVMAAIQAILPLSHCLPMA